jgi:CrcB protein
MAETVRLVQDGDLWRAALNALGSLLLCLAAVALGIGVMAL